ncbi:MAG: 30S ribosomal protein S17 [bacterium]
MNTPTTTTKKRIFRGRVVSVAMKKTIVVRVVRTRWHSKYRRQYRTSRTFKVHDEKNECTVGMLVDFVETRPLSKEKRWRLVRKDEPA